MNIEFVELFLSFVWCFVSGPQNRQRQFRRHLLGHQHHQRRGGRRQAGIDQGETPSTPLRIKTVQNSSGRGRNPTHQMVILKIILLKKAAGQVHKLVPFKRPPLKKLELQVIIIASVFGFFFKFSFTQSQLKWDFAMPFRNIVVKGKKLVELTWFSKFFKKFKLIFVPKFAK